jgi:hypothetical protein
MNKKNRIIKPFPRCPALDGYHCQTNSLAKIFYHHGYNLSEDMLLGLGSGMGFIYWFTKGNNPFVGGRGNLKNFFYDIGQRTGTEIKIKSTSSPKKAQDALLKDLTEQKPVMLYGDMGYLPWFTFGGDYHFGGHTFIICGFDGKNGILVSDIDQKSCGLKKGFYHPFDLAGLMTARDSKFKPFPPKNTYLAFNFHNFHYPNPSDIISALNQAAVSMLDPPIKNMGIKGIRHTAKEIIKWPQVFTKKELKFNLFSLYVFIEVAGTGSGSFRYMYARFIMEAAKILKMDALEKIAEKINQSGQLFTKTGLIFKDFKVDDSLQEKIKEASKKLLAISELEEQAFITLLKIIR